MGVLNVQRCKTKICVKCKYFIKDNGYGDGEFSKCSLFPREGFNDYRLVNGINYDNSIYYHYCATARSIEHMCGESGKMYKRKYVKKAIKNDVKKTVKNDVKNDVKKTVKNDVKKTVNQVYNSKADL